MTPITQHHVIFKRGVSRRCPWFYFRGKYLVCADKSHSSRWRRMSQGKLVNYKLYRQELLCLMFVWKVSNICMFFLKGIVWKSFGCCLLALYCSHVGHIHSKPCRLSDGRKNANNGTVARRAWSTIQNQLYCWWEAITFHLELCIAN